MTTYFVSGFMRSGTSMMMAALEAGGLDAVKDRRRDAYAKRFADADYSPNKQGLYELHRSAYRKAGFPSDYKGKLIKLLFGGIIKIAPIDDFKIVFMRRNMEEIRQSYEAFFGNPLRKRHKDVEQELDLACSILEQRRDVTLIKLQYKDVVEQPKKELTKLVASGWPIDVDKAAETIDPEQYRFRLENLDAGA